MSMYQKNPFPQPGAMDESRLMLMETAKLELESFSQVYNLISDKCISKCVAPGKGAGEELAVGETACLDRCLVKVLETQTFISTVLQKKQEMQMGAMMPGMGGPPGGPGGPGGMGGPPM